jgi:hypothetical protein
MCVGWQSALRPGASRVVQPGPSAAPIRLGLHISPPRGAPIVKLSVLTFPSSITGPLILIYDLESGCSSLSAANIIDTDSSLPGTQ